MTQGENPSQTVSNPQKKHRLSTWSGKPYFLFFFFFGDEEGGFPPRVSKCKR